MRSVECWKADFCFAGNCVSHKTENMLQCIISAEKQASAKSRHLFLADMIARESKAVEDSKSYAEHR